MMRIALAAIVVLAACSKDPPATTPIPAEDTTAAATADAAPEVAEATPDAAEAPAGPTSCDQIVARLAELGDEMDDCDDGRHTADDAACYLAAKDLAATWPCFLAVAARNVQTDAKELQARIVDAATSHATAHGAFPTGKTGLVPKKSCCKAKGRICHHAAATWRKGLWPTLLPEGVEATVFQVSYASKGGDQFELRLVADLDCDADLLVWAVTGTWLGRDLRLAYADPEFDD
jgi:hypothetical protein